MEVLKVFRAFTNDNDIPILNSKTFIPTNFLVDVLVTFKTKLIAVLKSDLRVNEVEKQLRDVMSVNDELFDTTGYVKSQLLETLTVCTDYNSIRSKLENVVKDIGNSHSLF